MSQSFLILLFLSLFLNITLCFLNHQLSVKNNVLDTSGISLQLARRKSYSHMVIVDLDDFADSAGAVDTRTDEEKGLSHGYEGNFKVGDKVRVVKENLRIWSVKQYMETGFICTGFCGVVHSLALYGRKKKALCSAITPIRVEFEPNGPGIPENMFEKKWIAHFDSTELELIKE